MGGRALDTSLWLWEAPGRAPRDTNPRPSGHEPAAPGPAAPAAGGGRRHLAGPRGPAGSVPGASTAPGSSLSPRSGVTPRSLAPFHRLSQEIVLPPLGFPRAAPVAVAGGAVCVNASPTCTERRLFPYEQTFVVKTGEGTS